MDDVVGALDRRLTELESQRLGVMERIGLHRSLSRKEAEVRANAQKQQIQALDSSAIDRRERNDALRQAAFDSRLPIRQVQDQRLATQTQHFLKSVENSAGFWSRHMQSMWRQYVEDKSDETPGTASTTPQLHEAVRSDPSLERRIGAAREIENRTQQELLIHQKECRQQLFLGHGCKQELGHEWINKKTEEDALPISLGSSEGYKTVAVRAVCGLSDSEKLHDCQQFAERQQAPGQASTPQTLPTIPCDSKNQKELSCISKPTRSNIEATTAVHNLAHNARSISIAQPTEPRHADTERDTLAQYPTNSHGIPTPAAASASSSVCSSTSKSSSSMRTTTSVAGNIGQSHCNNVSLVRSPSPPVSTNLSSSHQRTVRPPIEGTSASVFSPALDLKPSGASASANPHASKAYESQLHGVAEHVAIQSACFDSLFDMSQTVIHHTPLLPPSPPIPSTSFPLKIDTGSRQPPTRSALLLEKATANGSTPHTMPITRSHKPGTECGPQTEITTATTSMLPARSVAANPNLGYNPDTQQSLCRELIARSIVAQRSSAVVTLEEEDEIQDLSSLF
eukprot:GHVQ01024839.1.p1 GENE.GHVQ01024839.1~~GHVQ01024839.1.p1  ORF type:complete len:568 (-),score=77.64 GHVQ01024839.1:1134-2837(-)